MEGSGGLDKRKAWLFLLLVALGIVCVLVLIYVLMYARPKTTPTIQNGGHTLLQPAEPVSPLALVSIPEQSRDRSEHA